MAFTVREAAEGDFDALCAMFLDYNRELLSLGLHYEIDEPGLASAVLSRIKSRLILLAVAEEEGRLCGFAHCTVSRLPGEYRLSGGECCGHINDLYVAPCSRGRGMAGALCSFAEDWLRSCGVFSLELHALLKNQGANAFWLGRGMEPAATLYYKKLGPAGN